MRRPLCALLLAALLPAAPALAADEPDEAAVGVGQEAIVAPVARDTPTPTPTAPAATPTPTATPAGGGSVLPAVPQVQRAAGDNAALLPDPVKQREARERCVAGTSRMLASGGSQRMDDARSWAWLPFLIAAVCAALGLGAFAIRHRKSQSAAGQPPPSLLEVTATIVAICAGVAGLAAQFVPGVGVDDEPAPAATMQVRTVNARITREEFARRVGVEPPGSPLDRREVGNVIWLQIQLRGYRGRRLGLQWGSYETKPGAPLVAGTTYDAPIEVSEDSDEQTLFQPIWVGYPSLKRFHVQFRLLQRGEVREIASTGPMRGNLARYACEQRR